MKVYTTDRSTDRQTPERVKVGVADYAVAEADATLVTSGLGSCVAVALADVDAGVAGLAHAMLPFAAVAPDDGDPSDVDSTDSASAADASVADGGLAESVRDDDTEAKYVDTAVPGLLDSMTDAGADRSRIEARIAGGSAMFEFTAAEGAVGERNVAAAEAALVARGVPIVARDVGGDYGRSLRFDAATGELTVRRAHGDTRVI